MADEKSGQQLLIDAGPLGAGNGGHGHADALSVCLVRNGRNLLIDPGTFEYVGHGGEPLPRARHRRSQHDAGGWTGSGRRHWTVLLEESSAV